MLNSVLPILADNVRGQKALLQTIDDHGLSLIQTRVEAVFHVHFPGVSTEGEGGVPADMSVQEASVLDETEWTDEDDESCTCKHDDGGRVCG